MKKIRMLIALMMMTGAMVVAPLAQTSYAAVNIDNAKEVTETEACKQQGDRDGCKSGGAITQVFRTVANVLLFLVGAVAVIMLIIGGFRYVASNGDAAATKGAKDTIMYAIIGIIVAFLAYAAVNFVVTQLTIGTTTR